MPIQIPLPLRRGLATSGLLSPKRELRNSGAAFVYLVARAVFFAVAATCFGAGAGSTASGACRSSNSAPESLAPFSDAGAGIAALRANGSSQAGIFTSSSSKLDVAGDFALFGVCANKLASDLTGAVSILAAADSSVAMSNIFAAASPSSCLEGGTTEAAGAPSLCFRSAERRDDSCSCKRFASSFSPSMDGSAGARKSALLVGRESALISALNSCTSSARFGVTFSTIGRASTSNGGFVSAFVAGNSADNGAESNFCLSATGALA